MNTGDLSTSPKSVAGFNEHNQPSCPICFETYESTGGSQLLHLNTAKEGENFHRLCHDCAQKLLDSYKGKTGPRLCPICRSPFNAELLNQNLRNRAQRLGIGPWKFN